MRTARFLVPNVVYHLIWRFVDREWFFTSDEERKVYLRLLGGALRDSDWKCLAYALMSNHIHLAIVAGVASLASWSIRVHTPFAQWMNERHGRLGPLFARGPKDLAVGPLKEGHLIAYVHNNPVRAGLVARASGSSWTSHRAYIGLAPAPGWLHVAEGLTRSGFDAPEAFDQWIAETPGESGSVDLADMRREIRKRGALELATPLIGDTNVVPVLARPFAHVRADPERLVQITSEVIGIPKLELCSRGRSPLVVVGRRVAVRAGHALGLVGADIAAALAVSHQAVSRIARVEIDETVRAPCAKVIERMHHEMSLEGLGLKR